MQDLREFTLETLTAGCPGDGDSCVQDPDDDTGYQDVVSFLRGLFQ